MCGSPLKKNEKVQTGEEIQFSHCDGFRNLRILSESVRILELSTYLLIDS